MEPQHHIPAALLPAISAQLRTAMSNLRFAASAIAPPEEREQDPELDARAALLDQSYYRLLRLVNELSAASLMEREGPLPVRDMDLGRLVERICREAEYPAELLGLRLSMTGQTEGLLCAVHQQGIEQLLFQLLSNAFKFTPKGGMVTVALRRSGSRILLSVQDTGCGIPEDKLAVLFDRYLHPERMDPEPHGLGLGLALCWRIAVGHGGTLLAENVDPGARFTLSIPDQLCGNCDISDIAIDYNSGFNPTLLALADALPPEAFLIRNQD